MNGCDHGFGFHRYFCPLNSGGPGIPVLPEVPERECAEHDPLHWRTCAACTKPIFVEIESENGFGGSGGSDECDDVDSDVSTPLWRAYEESRGLANEKKRSREEREERDDQEVEWGEIDKKQQVVANMILEHLSTKPSAPIREVIDVWRENIIACREQEKRLKKELALSLDLIERFFQ